jgi:hypothetical protein
MRCGITTRLFFAVLAACCASTLGAQTVVDRILVRIEDDILLLSEMRELGLYQQLLNGKAEDGNALLVELTEQWIVKTEAATAAFPRPSDADVDHALQALEKPFASPQAFRERLDQIGLSTSTLRHVVAQQLWIARYLDYKFRPAAQVESADVEKYYREELVSALAARGQSPPPPDVVREQIRELLVQREINRRATQWLEEARSRLKIEILQPRNGDEGK